MPFTVYILQSLKDQSFYIGSTSDMERRLQEHNQGLSAYTSTKTPWRVAYTELYETRTEAMKREAFLKRQRNKVFYQRLIDSNK
ncbi:MAG: GIY-YIG nuclease family protein [Chitinophagales bacterium]